MYVNDYRCWWGFFVFFGVGSVFYIFVVVSFCIFVIVMKIVMFACFIG